MALDRSVSPVPELLEIVHELAGVFDDFDDDQRIIALLGTEQPSSWDKALLDVVDRSVRDALIGFTAPPEIWALGVVAGGWASPPDAYDPDEAARGRVAQRPSSHPDARRVRMISITTRTGITVSRLALAGSWAREFVTDDAFDDTGLIADATRRALGLPTTPPAAEVSELLSSIWLHEIISLAEASSEPIRSWSEVQALHPAVRLAWEGMGLASEVAPAARALGRVLTWKMVREQCVEREWLHSIVDPELAAWMDEGMLSRWLLSAMLPLDELSRQASTRLWPGVAAQLRAALRAIHGADLGDPTAGADGGQSQADHDDSADAA